MKPPRSPSRRRGTPPPQAGGPPIRQERQGKLRRLGSPEMAMTPPTAPSCHTPVHPFDPATQEGTALVSFGCPWPRFATPPPFPSAPARGELLPRSCGERLQGPSPFQPRRAHVLSSHPSRPFQGPLRPRLSRAHARPGGAPVAVRLYGGPGRLLGEGTLLPTIASMAAKHQRDAFRCATTASNERHGDSAYQAVFAVPQEREHAVVVSSGTRDAVHHLHSSPQERGFAVVAPAGDLGRADRNWAFQAHHVGLCWIMPLVYRRGRGGNSEIGEFLIRPQVAPSEISPPAAGRSASFVRWPDRKAPGIRIEPTKP